MSESGMGSRGQSDRREDESDDEGPSLADRLIVVTSTVFTLLLFAYVIWQGATTPIDASPTATVVGTDTLQDGSVEVTVEFENPQDIGLVSATVEVDCGTPPPELTFDHVPADDRRTGYVICPSGTENPSASVTSWTEA